MATKAKAKKVKGGRQKVASAPAATVLVLRSCEADMTSYGGFIWPQTGPVEAPDWDSEAKCGNGLHGWLWGHGDWALKAKDADAKWLVVEVVAADVVDLAGKVKFPRGNVLATFGHWRDAMEFVRARRPFDPAAGTTATGYSGHAAATGHSGHAAATGHYGHAAATGYYGHAAATGHYGHAAATGESGHAAATGHYGHAAATGYSGHAAATGHYGHAAATGESGHAAATGHYGHAAATGDYGHAAATGYYGHAAATGDYGHAAATGYSGHAAATGESGWAACGIKGRAKAGVGGVLTLLWVDSEMRKRVTVAYVGEDGVKADTWYVVDKGGALIEVPS